MYVDERINSIMKKIENFSEKQPEFTCGEFPPKWNPPLEAKVIENFEKENGIILPEDYKRFITTVASSGTQPFYGLYSLVGKLSKRELNVAVNKKFPYTVKTPLDIMELSDESRELKNKFEFMC